MYGFELVGPQTTGSDRYSKSAFYGAGGLQETEKKDLQNKLEITCRVPTRTGKPGKPGKMGRHFPVREKSGNFEQIGKVREKSGKTTRNTGKLR